MAKKKGSLKSAIASYNREREAKAHQKAVQEAQQRKLDSYGRPNKHQKLSKSPSPKTSASGPSSSSSANDQHDQPSGSNHVSTRTHNRTVEPFSSEDTILIVGEANFSFTLALLNPPRSHAPHQILSTAYDSEDECYQKYPDAKENVRKIRKIAGRDDVVIFGVDAGQLDKVRQVTGRSKAQKLKAADDPSEALAAQRRWSKVWFGFPHVGECRDLPKTSKNARLPIDVFHLRRRAQGRNEKRSGQPTPPSSLLHICSTLSHPRKVNVPNQAVPPP